MRINAKKGTKLLAFLVTLGMLLGMLPSAVFAENAEKPQNAVLIDEATFPDEAFRTVVGGFDADADGTLSAKELSVVTELDCSGMKIVSLEGVQHFTALQKLVCRNNPLTILDVSQMDLIQLDCANCAELTNLTVGPQLQKLDCRNTALTELDLRNAGKLKQLTCTGTALETLDLAGTKIRTVDKGMLPETLLTLHVPDGVRVRVLSVQQLTNHAE